MTQDPFTPAVAEGRPDRGGREAVRVTRPTLTVDLSEFDHHFADSDLTEQEKREFLEAWWYVVVTFVDLGYGIEAVQQALMAGEAIAPGLDDGADRGRALANGFRSASGNNNKKDSDRRGPSP